MMVVIEASDELVLGEMACFSFRCQVHGIVIDTLERFH